MNVCITRLLLPGILALALSASAFSAQPDELFRTHVYSDTLLVEPGSDASFDFDVDLIVSGPEGFHHRESFTAGSVVEFGPSTIAQGQLPDGSYKYELRIMGTGQPLVRGTDQPQAASPALSSPHSGAFTIKSGSIVSPDEVEPVAEVQKDTGNSSLHTEDADDGGARDVVTNDDQIITGSLCVGFDCVNGETFGFDTIRMKENNTRIKFEDTSSSGSFPTNDWELVANDSANGGLNRFIIRDVDGNRNSVTVEAGARSNALYVESGNDVGFGTANPVLNLHVADGDSPGLRLEQDGSSGFSPQTWDIAGNESNFFVRDATNGSTLPFRIQPGAPSSSIYISSTGNVGFGLSAPDHPLVIQRTDDTAQIRVVDTGTSNGQTMFSLEKNGHPRFRLRNTALDSNWDMRTAGSGSSEQFQITNFSGGVSAFPMRVFKNGNVEIEGTLTQSSDRNMKNDFQKINPGEVLQQVMALPITRWTFNHEDAGVFHMGPMAQDFYSTFGLGRNETKIAPLDTSGVALAAIQGLKLELDSRDQRIAELEQRVDELKSGMVRVAEMETRLQELNERVADAILVNREDVASSPEVVQSHE